MIRCRASLLAGCLVLGVLGPVVSAGISVSPLKQEVTVKPGGTIQFKLTVSNNPRAGRDTPQTVRLEVMDVAVSQEGALAFTERGRQRNSASNWISLVASELTLEPGESRAVECSLTAPYSAVGEYYSAVMVTLANEGRTDAGVSLTYRIASGVFVTVAGRSFPREAKITGCEVVWPQPPGPAPSTQPARPGSATVAVVLQNTGRARFDGSGKLSILDSRSRAVFTAPLVSQRPCVFGGDSRLFEAALDRPLPVGRYVVRVEMDYQSGWAKAYRRLPLDITLEKAELLKAVQKASRQGNVPLVQPSPDRIPLAMPPGALRSVRLTLKSNAEEALPCAAKLVFEGDRPVNASWVSVTPEGFELSKSGQQTLELVVRAPVDAAPERYTCTVLIEAAPGGADVLHIRVPLELQVKAEN